MRGVLVTEAGGCELRDLPEPGLPAGGVLLRVRLCGLCGSDVEKLHAGSPAAGRVLGHELSGEVLAGALAPGTRVTLCHHVACGTCQRCRAGDEPLCPQYAATSLDPGGFCERTVAGPAHVARSLLALPAGVSDLAGTFVEPLACVLRGIDALPGGGPSLVVGGGSIGLLAAQALRARGDAPVRVLEPDARRQARAAALDLAPPAPGERFQGAFCTVAAAIGDAIALLEAKGTLVVFAGGAPRPVPVDEIYRRELRLVGVRSCGADHLRRALASLADGLVQVEALVDEVLPLEDFDEGLRRYRSRETLKVVFAP